MKNVFILKFISHCRNYCIQKGYIDFPISAKQLSKKLSNLKTAAKKTASEHKAATRATGGGRPPPPIDEQTVKILSVFPNDSEIPSLFDSEYVMHVDEENIEIEIEEHPEHQELPELEDDHLEDQNNNSNENR